MMNRNIFTIIVLSFVLFSKAQNTITVEQAGYYIDNEISFPPEVDRVVDSNNVLTPFVGKWSGIFNGKTYIFKIYKLTQTNSYDNITSDDLFISYKILDATGTTLFTSSSTSYSEMNGIFLSPRGHYYSTLADPCGNHADVIIIADHSGQTNNGGIIDLSNFNKIKVYVYTIKELLNVPPLNCVSISEQFPNETIFVLDKI